jgi:hypothetical protein
MHFSLSPATQADGRKIIIRQAVVNFTDWQAARPEEKIFRATTIDDDGYQTRATTQLERGESGQKWPLIILAKILAILGIGIVAAGSAAFMFRRRIARELLTATLAPRATEETATVVQTRQGSPRLKRRRRPGERATSRDHWRGRKQGGKKRESPWDWSTKGRDLLLTDWRALQGSW